MTTPRLRKSILTILATLLFIGGTAYLAKGVRLSWGADNDGDMQKLRTEYALFAKGVYPHGLVAEAAGTPGVESYAIYPPYTYPLLTAVFWPRSLEGARAVFQLLTLAALAVLMGYGAKELRAEGRPAALLGAAIPFAFSGNSSAVALGQFTIICVGFLALQILLLQRGLPSLAGLCWACAMIKPQIGLPFALLFLVKPHWSGLLAGGAALATLTALAFGWTNVHPLHFWTHGVASHRLEFASEVGHGSSVWIDFFGANPQLAALAGLGAVALSAALLLCRRGGKRLSFEGAAAVAAVLAMSLFYHRHYDGVVWVFLALPLVGATLRDGSPLLLAATASLALIIYTPASVIARLAEITPATDWLVLTIPIAACAILLAYSGRPKD